MKHLLITGGTVFVSRFVAQYFVKKGYEVTVLNRNSRPQVEGVHLICADRNHLQDELKCQNFDAVIDVCAYHSLDIEHLLQALPKVQDYVFISSSAVYPETNPQPFSEDQKIGPNSIWKDYGTNKADAEKYLLTKVPQAYILRPPYLYGPMQNLYREPFVFECALKNRPFYLPENGNMKLQFFHVEDLCRMIELLITKHPKHHIYNVGNESTVDVKTFVELCYQVAQAKLQMIPVTQHENQRDYFSFHDYEYELDVTRQKELLCDTKDLITGLKESFDWYCAHPQDHVRKDYIEFIDKHFTS